MTDIVPSHTGLYRNAARTINDYYHLTFCQEEYILDEVVAFAQAWPKESTL